MLTHLVISAHAGHLLIDAPVFIGPVIILVAWLLLFAWRERRRERRPSAPGKRG